MHKFDQNFKKKYPGDNWRDKYTEEPSEDHIAEKIKKRVREKIKGQWNELEKRKDIPREIGQWTRWLILKK